MQRRWLFGLLGLLAFTCDEAAGPPDEIVGACQRLAECDGELAEPERQCRERFEAEYDEAASYGCGSAYVGWLSCLATTRGQCRPPFIISDSFSGAEPAPSSGPGPEPYVDPCQDEYEVFRDCQGRMRRDECDVVSYGGAGGCSVECALFSGLCVATTDQRSSCRCEQGAKIGATFTGACGTAELELLARDACQ